MKVGYRGPVTQWLCNGLLIREMWVRVPPDPLPMWESAPFVMAISQGVWAWCDLPFPIAARLLCLSCYITSTIKGGLSCRCSTMVVHAPCKRGVPSSSLGGGFSCGAWHRACIPDRPAYAKGFILRDAFGFNSRTPLHTISYGNCKNRCIFPMKTVSYSHKRH